jgi:hypothetical protein
MPSLYHPRGAPGVVDADQSASSQMSGFYGPGTWAAWIIALATSVIAVRKHHDDHAALSLIPPILYVNWAAVDLLKHLHSEDLSLVASATSITLLGVWYLFLVQILLRTHDDEGCVKCQRRVIRGVCVLGFVIPFSALIAIILSTDGAMSIRKRHGVIFVSNTTGYELFIFFIYMLVCFWYHALVAWRVACPQRPHSPKKFDTADRILLWCTFPFMPMEGPMYFEYVFEHAATLRGLSDYHWTCTRKPCAPQSITELDQGFALCCGVLLFVYEVGPDVVNFIRKRSKAVMRTSD